MSHIRLQDDLFQEYKEERKMVYEQLKVLDPLATSLRKPAAQRLISNGYLLIVEILCYLFFLGGIALMFFMNKIFPFYVLSDFLYNVKMNHQVGMMDATYLNLAVYGLVLLAALLFLMLGRNTRKIRLKNQILSLAGKDMKLLVEKCLQRKAAIDVIDQRHFAELPLNEDGLYITSKHKPKIAEIPNPGFDDMEDSRLEGDL